MKKRIGSILILFTSILLSLSCTDVVQTRLEEGSELIVIDAFLESRFDVQVIFIHKNSSYYNTTKPEPITNADVTLYDLTANTFQKFYHTQEDKYQIFPWKEYFVANHQYKLEVVIDGFIYTALTVEPRSALADSISIKAYNKNQITGESTNLYYMSSLWAKDKADNNPDYYWIKTNRVSASMNLCIDGSSGIVKDVKEDSIYFRAPYIYLGFETFAPGDFVNVDINAITKETYDFLLQAQEQINNGGMFATTPENVKTNFTTPKDAKIKAVGWFSVANVSSTSKSIPK